MDLDFQDKTDLVLNKSQSDIENPIETPFCVGISENLLTWLGYQISSLDPKILPLSEIPETELKISIYNGLLFRNVPVPIVFRIDALNKVIEFSVSLLFDFFDSATPSSSFAQAKCILKCKAEPFMATSHQNYLAFSIKEIQLDGVISYPTLNEEEIIRRFGSIPNFKQYVERSIEQISQVDVKSEFNNIVPSVFSAIELPNTWRQVEGYEVKYERMYYEEGTIIDEPRGFLFIVFSVKSLLLPPPCQCIPNKEEHDLKRQSSSVILSNDNFVDEDRWITVGISRSAFEEIIKPYTHFGQRVDMNFRTFKGIAVGEVFYWFQFQAGNFTIFPDGISIDVAFDTGGQITGYIKAPLGGEFGYKAVDIRLDIDRILLQATISSRRNRERRGTEIIVQPHVEISEPKLEIDGPIPWPISEVIEKIGEHFAKEEVSKLTNKVDEKMTIFLFASRIPINGDFGLFLERTDYYHNSSVVITGLGTND